MSKGDMKVNYLGRTVGTISDKIYYTQRGPDSVLKKHDAFTIGTGVLEKLLYNKVEMICIDHTLTDKKIRYNVSIMDFIEKSLPHLHVNKAGTRFKPIMRYNLMLACPRKYMRCDAGNDSQTTL